MRDDPIVAVTRVSGKGLVLIPLAIREKLDLHPGTKLIVVAVEDVGAPEGRAAARQGISARDTGKNPLNILQGADKEHRGMTGSELCGRPRTFTNEVGEIAEEEGHHPAILTEWGRVTVTWWTHKIKGLHRNDFIMAAKTDRVS